MDLWACPESCCHTQGPPPATRLHQGINTLFSLSRYTLVLTFKPTSNMWGDIMWHSLESTPNHNPSRKLCFHHPVHVPVIRDNPDLHFEVACNGPVVITWIGKEHVFYSGASPISLVEHFVTFRHDRRLLSLLGFVHNWQTSRWSATKKENRFSFDGNRIMSSFQGDNFIVPPCNKTPDMKLGWSVDDVMPGGDGPENLRILKKSQSRIEIRPWRHRVAFLPLKDVVGFFGSLPTVILNIIRCAARWGGLVS